MKSTSDDQHKQPEPETALGSVLNRDELLKKCLPLVTAIARSIKANLPTCVELDDLIQDGMIGLLQVVERYDPKKQVDVLTFAKYRIRGAILDGLRALDPASREARRMHKRIEDTISTLTTKFERAPSSQEVADKLGMNEGELRRAQVELAHLTPASMSFFADKEWHELQVEGRPEFRPDNLFSATEFNGALARALQTLPKRNQQLIDMYYRHGMSMKEIGVELGVNESRISQIHKACLAKLAQQLSQTPAQR